MRGAFRTRRISELGGWAVRAPLLAFALVLIAAAARRIPRARRVGGAGEPRRPDDRRADRDHRRRLVGRPVAIYGRLLLVGLSKPSAAVVAGLSERPTWPDIVEGRRVVGLSRAERAFERGGHAIGGSLDVLWGIPAAIRANRALLAGAIAVLVCALALSLSAGGFGVVEASQAVPAPGGPGPAEGPGAPSSEAPGRRRRSNRRAPSRRRRGPASADRVAVSVEPPPPSVGPSVLPSASPS